MKPILEIQNISKRYSLKGKAGVTTLGEEIYRLFQAGKRRKETFFALDDISTAIYRGESIGIIGSNGAGKSTLLKILSGVTSPSSGTVTVRGSVASILEVGAGFHPDLTGRENIYLGGALHGLSRRDMKQKFDAIVDFSGIEDFLDAPFKHYSSGMQVRLGFSIISHIESDVLITDEVLAVGDAAFQKKSLQKMKDSFQQGRTVIFVSHQQNMVSTLTQRTLLIRKGKLIADGATDDVIRQYFYEREAVRSLFKNDQPAEKGQYALLAEAGITDLEGNLLQKEIDVSEDYKVYMEFDVLGSSGYDLIAVMQVKVPEGYLAFVSAFGHFDESQKQKGRTRVECIIPGNLLNTGQYQISLSLITEVMQLEHFKHENCLSYTIKDKNPFTFYGDYTGWNKPRLHWETSRV